MTRKTRVIVLGTIHEEKSQCPESDINTPQIRGTASPGYFAYTFAARAGLERRDGKESGGRIFSEGANSEPLSRKKSGLRPDRDGDEVPLQYQMANPPLPSTHPMDAPRRRRGEILQLY